MWFEAENGWLEAENMSIRFDCDSETRNLFFLFLDNDSNLIGYLKNTLWKKKKNYLRLTCQSSINLWLRVKKIKNYSFFFFPLSSTFKNRKTQNLGIFWGTRTPLLTSQIGTFMRRMKILGYQIKKIRLFENELNSLGGSFYSFFTVTLYIVFNANTIEEEEKTLTEVVPEV